MTIATSRRSWLLIGVVVLAVLSGGLWVLARRGEASLVADLPQPHEVWLVYARPTGPPTLGRGPQEIDRATPDRGRSGPAWDRAGPGALAGRAVGCVLA